MFRPVYEQIQGIGCDALHRVGRRKGSLHRRQMTSTSADVKCDEGARAEYGLSVMATTTRATITVAGADAQRLGFMAFAPVHKQIHGFDPDWRFDDDESAMSTACTMLCLPFRAACLDNADGSATISLTIAAQ